MLSTEDLQRISELETRLTLPQGFSTALFEENDWSFVIKFHALFEAVMTRLLSHHLGRNELTDVFARLEMSNNGYGKLAFAKALGYIEDNERRFVRNWSELRNALVHDVTNVSFSFTAHISLLDAKMTKNFFTKFYIEAYFQPDINNAEQYEALRQNPKQFLFLGALSLLHSISHYFDWADFDRLTEHHNWFQNLVNENREQGE